MSTDTRGARPTPEEVADVLIAERDAVLGEMPHRHGWGGASLAAMQEAVDHAISQLWSRAYNDLDHVRASLRWAVKRRAKEHWNPRNHAVEERLGLEDDAFERFAVAYDDHDAVVEALSAEALMPFARDCLAELTEAQAQIIRLRTEDLGERAIARHLGLERKDVQRELYYAEKAIARFAMVLEAGRVCATRAPAIAAYSDGIADSDDVRRAEAHLDVCPACMAAYEQTKSALGAQVAALVPLPALAIVSGHGRFGAIFARLGELVGGNGGGGGRVEALRETALSVFARNPATAETMTGAGLGGAGIAVGAKAAIGLCVAALAGGSAVCSSLGVLPDGLNIRQPDKPKVAKTKPMAKPKRTAKAPATTSTTSSFTAPTPAPTLSATTSTRPTVSNPSEAARAARERRRRAARAKAARKRAVAARAAATNSLQSSAPTGATSTAPPAAAAPPPAPPVQAPAPTTSSAPKRSSGTASPALTGTSGGFENGTP